MIIRLRIFLFSCRTLGMGIEQYTYEKIGCPKLDIVGDVSVKIGKKRADCNVDKSR